MRWVADLRESCFADLESLSLYFKIQTMFGDLISSRLCTEKVREREMRAPILIVCRILSNLMEDWRSSLLGIVSRSFSIPCKKWLSLFLVNLCFVNLSMELQSNQGVLSLLFVLPQIYNQIIVFRELVLVVALKKERGLLPRLFHYHIKRRVYPLICCLRPQIVIAFSMPICCNVLRIYLRLFPFKFMHVKCC